MVFAMETSTAALDVDVGGGAGGGGCENGDDVGSQLSPESPLIAHWKGQSGALRRLLPLVGGACQQSP